MRFDNRLFLILFPAAALLSLLVWGIARLLFVTIYAGGHFTLDSYYAFFARSDYLEMLWRTVYIAALTAIISLVIGYPVAYCISRYSKHKDLLLFLIIVPWLISLIVRTYGWMVLLGNRGIINNLLMASGLTDSPTHLMFNTLGVLIGMVHAFCPFMILAVLSALMHLDRDLEEASMSLGAGPIRTFLRVTLPMTIPGVMSGTIIIYLIATGAIITPLMLGGVRNTVLGSILYSDIVDRFDFPKAATTAVVLTVAAFAVVIPLQLVERRLNRNLAADHAE
jgi:putative spermidine/putrescine transport system permease protein